jgi:hypothetical protein
MARDAMRRHAEPSEPALRAGLQLERGPIAPQAFEIPGLVEENRVWFLLRPTLILLRLALILLRSPFEIVAPDFEIVAARDSQTLRFA